MKNLLSAFSLWDKARLILVQNIRRNPDNEQLAGVINVMSEEIDKAIAFLQAAKAQLK